MVPSSLQLGEQPAAGQKVLERHPPRARRTLLVRCLHSLSALLSWFSMPVAALLHKAKQKVSGLGDAKPGH